MWKLLKEDVTCVFERDPAARGVFDVLTCYSCLLYTSDAADE